MIVKLNQLIEDNFDNPNFSSDLIYQELGMSRSQLYRLIKDEYQLSTSLYIRKIKIAKAKELLENSNLKISEISYKIGIDSPQNFTKYFTQEFGINPTEFRKNLPIKNKSFVEQSVDNEIVIKKKYALEKQRMLIYLGIIILTILLTSIGIYYWQNDRTSSINKATSTEFSEHSIAILPFKNLGDSLKSYFSEGVMEQIHSSLASLNDLKVISTTSSNKYLNTPKSIPQIAQELRVNYLLAGSVLQVGRNVRIKVDLISAKDQRVIWTKSFEGETKNIFTYMNIVSKEVAIELDQKLNRKVTDKFDKKPTISLAAYNDFLQGQQLLQSRIREKIKASLIKFENAIKFDPTFADAFTNIAVAYFLMGEDQYMDVESAYKMAEKNALKAINLDAENGRAYAVLGNLYKVQNKWEQAITTFQIALKFSPNDAQINYWYSLTVRSIGQMDEAIKYSTKAVSLDPLASNIYGGHIIGCAYAGRFDLAENAIKDGELIFNDAMLFHNAKAFYYITRHNYLAALKEFNICEKLNGKTPFNDSMIAFSEGKLGQTAPVNIYLKNFSQKPENYKYIAIIYAGLGNKKLCLKYLELASENNDSPNYLKTSPLFVFLHHEPRFKAILQKLGLLNSLFSTH
ncbi:helix-turn-helix domain-containing protein [Emticicia sp. SJ17W-69]|uniref:helix-turn-helix domain-containing protein n=1 Tax=Emticicia sp. SJ17W-69 TaxID=3421657 RepID=UPI003EBA7DE5